MKQTFALFSALFMTAILVSPMVAQASSTAASSALFLNAALLA